MIGQPADPPMLHFIDDDISNDYARVTEVSRKGRAASEKVVGFAHRLQVGVGERVA